MFTAAIVLAAFGALALGLAAVARRAAARATDSQTRDDATGGARICLATGVFLVGLAVLFTALSATTTVGTKKVGVVTSFGRPTGTVLPNGFHFKAPWERTTELDGAIKTDSYAPESTGGDREGDCITVRIAHQATACVSVSARWRISPDSADALFRDYKTFDNIRASLVTRDLRAALNGVFATYDPLGTVDDKTTVPTYDTLSKQSTTALTARVGAPIDVQSVVVSHVAFDRTTQDRINALQGEVAQTRIATQREATVAAEARANGVLSASVSRDPNVLVSQCMTTLRTAVDRGQALPAGFSCWPASAAEFAVTR